MRNAVTILTTALVGAATCLAPQAAAQARPAPPPAAGSSRTPVVTLTFDDGTADHAAVAGLLTWYGLRGTFFVNSGTLDSGPGYLTTRQALDMQRRGHEIGGHTVTQARLAEQSPAEQKRQICVDRNQLLGSGLRATDFAYPGTDFGPATQRIVRECGYRSGRTVVGRFESLPPANPWQTRARAGFGRGTTVGDLKRAVGRPWTQLAFHQICERDCGPRAVPFEEFAGFVAWLAERSELGLLRVATVNQVVGRKMLPPVAPPPPRARGLTFGNASFEQAGSCFLGAWTRVPQARSGQAAARVITSGGDRLRTAQDLGDCAPPITAGTAYRVGFWYQATAPIEVVSYARRPRGLYRKFGTVVSFPAASAWRLASWVTAAAPAHPGMALSLGISMPSAGTYYFDDLTLADNTVVPPTGSAGAVPRPQPTVSRTVPAPVPSAPAVTPASSPAATPSSAVPSSAVPSSAVPSSAAPVPAPSVELVPVPAPFLPPDPNPLNPLKEARQSAELAGPPKWLGAVSLVVALIIAFVAVALLDRRFWHLHQRTKRPTNPRG